PAAAVARPGQAQARQILGTGHIPIPELSADQQRRAIARAVTALPGACIGLEPNALFLPVDAGARCGKAWAPGRAVDTRVEVVEYAVAADYRGVQRVVRIECSRRASAQHGLRARAQRELDIARGTRGRRQCEIGIAPAPGEHDTREERDAPHL